MVVASHCIRRRFHQFTFPVRSVNAGVIQRNWMARRHDRTNLAMTDTARTECKKCNAVILQSTAVATGGRCRKCEIKPENVAEGIEWGLRSILGIVFACIFAPAGYLLGSFLGTAGSIVCAIPFAIVGFLVGCFIVEIKSILRLLIPFLD